MTSYNAKEKKVVVPHYMMLTLPNSGSSWFARVLASHLPDCRYTGEFFNPLRNPKHERLLAGHFGCELVSCYRHIASAGDEAIDEIIRSTWGEEGFNFTKEVFSPFKLEAFNRHFRCFVFLRDAEQTFPPARLRIWSFYEHAWFALHEAGENLIGTSARARAIEAHQVLANRMLEDARRLGVPTINYNELFEDRHSIRRTLEKALGFSSEDLIDEICLTRKATERPVDQPALV